MLAGIAVLLMSFSMTYQSDKSITETFTVNGIPNLLIDNLHGNVNIKVWDKSEIRIEVNVDVNSRNEKAASEFIEKTEIEFSQDGNNVFAITKLAKVDLKKKWWQFGSDDYQFSVNYEVFIPETTHLKVENEHGDIRIAAFDGDLDVDLAHGIVYTANITGKTDLKVEHSEAVIQGLTNGKLDISYSEFETQRAGNLEIKSIKSEVDINEALNITAYTKYDEYKIGTMDNLIHEGAYDEIKIGQLRYLDAQSRFTEYEIDVCEVGIKGDLYSGELIIEHISPAFIGGELVFEHTEVDLTFDNEVNVNVDSEFTELDLENLNGPPIDSDRIQGIFYLGSGKSAHVLQIKSKFGELDINN